MDIEEDEEDYKPPNLSESFDTFGGETKRQKKRGVSNNEDHIRIASPPKIKKGTKRKSTAGFGNIDINNMDILGDIGEEIEDEGDDIYEKFEDSTPIWAREGHRRDAEKRTESDPKYDP